MQVKVVNTNVVPCVEVRSERVGDGSTTKLVVVPS